MSQVATAVVPHTNVRWHKPQETNTKGIAINNRYWNVLFVIKRGKDLDPDPPTIEADLPGTFRYRRDDESSPWHALVATQNDQFVEADTSFDNQQLLSERSWSRQYADTAEHPPRAHGASALFLSYVSSHSDSMNSISLPTWACQRISVLSI